MSRSNQPSPFGIKDSTDLNLNEPQLVSPSGNKLNSALGRFSIKVDIERGVLSPDALKSPIELENDMKAQ